MTASTRAKKPTTPQQWKKQLAEPTELPSGNYMRLRRVSMQMLIATGKLPNALHNIVKKAVDKGTGVAGVESEMSEIVGDDKQLAEMMVFMDTLVMQVAIEPEVHPVPENQAERRDDVLYIDEIDQDDKSFIFALVTGGTSTLEQFRRATETNVAAVSGRQDVELPAE